MKEKKPEMTITEFARLGALAVNRSRTPEERKEFARRAVQVRWAKYRREKGGGKASK
jgi:hypothetical protein